MPPLVELKQIPLKEMKHGLAKPIARIRMEPAEISEKFGIHFQSSQDDLDLLDAALLGAKSGMQLALVRHRHQPKPGTDIIASEHSDDPTRDLAEAMRILTIGPMDLNWIHPDIDEKQLSSLGWWDVLSSPRKARARSGVATRKRPIGFAAIRIDDSPSGLAKIRREIEAAKKTVFAALETLNRGAKRRVAASAKAKLATASRARWGKTSRSSGGKKGAKGKGRITAAGRKKLSQIMRKRWAARRKASGKRRK